MILITGLGHISSLGQGRESLIAVMNGKPRPLPQVRKVKTRGGEVDVQTLLAPEAALPSSVPESVQRRMPKISKMFFSAAMEAAEEAFSLGDESFLKAHPTRVGLVVGTAFGAIDLSNLFEKRVVVEGPAGASPNLFATSVQNAVASSLSLSLGIQGPSTTVTTLEHTAVGALCIAADWLGQGAVDQVLVAVGDEVSEMHGYAAAHLEERPIIGEGVVAFVLSRGTGPNGSSYARIEDLRPFTENTPRPEDFVADLRPHGYQTHQHWFGALATGGAFEIAIAALKVRADKSPLNCFQFTTHGEAQSVRLTPPV